MIALSDYYTTLSILVTLLLIWLYKWYKRPAHFPPGPRGLPFIGILPFLGGYPEKKMKKWSKIYGPVMSVRLGPKDVVVLNDFDSIQKAFVKQPTKFSGRPQPKFVTQFTEGLGVAFADYGELWKIQRKFGLLTLRGFGVGRQSLENKIIEETSYFNNVIREHNGEAFNISELLHNAVGNIIYNIGFGKRFDYDDERFRYILRRFIEVTEDPVANFLSFIFFFAPILMKIPPFSMYNNKMLADLNLTKDLLREVIDENEQTFDESNIRNFIDAFLLEMEKKTHDSFTRRQLLQYVRDLFEAGTETTSSTLNWSLLCLLHYPQIQKRLRKEIEEAIGLEGKITFQKRSEMPFTCAFMEEVFRYRTLTPLGLQHSTSEDANLDGYFIPKGTMVMGNFWAVHNDENTWEKPEIFNPDRFLDEKGDFVRSANVVPFSVGPRHCLGEQFARMEFFIFLVSLVRRFEFLPDPKAESLPDIDKGSNGLVFVPTPYKLVAKVL